MTDPNDRRPGERRPAVLFYSRGGHSRRLALDLARRLDAETVEITTPRYHAGPLSWPRMVADSLHGHHPPIEPLPPLADRPFAVLCAPVWAGAPATPLIGALAGEIALPERVGVFLTGADPDPQREALLKAEMALGRSLAAAASLGNGVEGSAEAEDGIEAFCRSMIEGTVSEADPRAAAPA
jgi:hypothetical protein